MLCFVRWNDKWPDLNDRRVSAFLLLHLKGSCEHVTHLTVWLWLSNSKGNNSLWCPQRQGIPHRCHVLQHHSILSFRSAPWTNCLSYLKIKSDSARADKQSSALTYNTELNFARFTVDGFVFRDSQQSQLLAEQQKLFQNIAKCQNLLNGCFKKRKKSFCVSFRKELYRNAFTYFTSP